MNIANRLGGGNKWKSGKLLLEKEVIEGNELKAIINE